jgi:hypothetical protein
MNEQLKEIAQKVVSYISKKSFLHRNEFSGVAHNAELSGAQ